MSCNCISSEGETIYCGECSAKRGEAGLAVRDAYEARGLEIADKQTIICALIDSNNALRAELAEEWAKSSCETYRQRAEKAEALVEQLRKDVFTCSEVVGKAERERALLYESLERGGAGRCSCDHAPCRHDAHRFIAERDAAIQRAEKAEQELEESRVRLILVEADQRHWEGVAAVRWVKCENAEKERDWANQERDELRAKLATAERERDEATRRKEIAQSVNVAERKQTFDAVASYSKRLADEQTLHRETVRERDDLRAQLVEAEETLQHANAGHARTDACFRILHERNDLSVRLAACVAAKDGAYSERNKLVVLLAWLAIARGWRAGVGEHRDQPGVEWGADWRTLVVIELPTGQAAWHFHDSERSLLDGLPVYDGEWDGHDTPEKYRRILALAAAKGGG